MKAINLLAAAVLVGGSTALLSFAAPGAPEGARSASSATLSVADDVYDALAADYDAAQADFDAKLKAADKNGRRALRKNAPINEYWEKFSGLASKGNGQAMLWLVDHLRDNRSIRSKQRPEVVAPLYKGLFGEHIDAEWFEGAMKSLARDKSYVGAEETLAYFEKAVAESKSDRTTAAALFFAATELSESNPKKAAQYMERIASDFANTVYGTAARAKNAKPTDSEVGKVAPDFVAQTIDGFQFSLEDYRGKVAVLDFYGFW